MAALKSKPSQELIPIKEIRDGVLILKDSSLRAILMASSLNFALKSTEEQEAIIIQFQNFLNSLDFSIQFFVQSRKLNIEPYLDTLRRAEQQQNNELLKIQTKEYIEFIKGFVEMTNIVSKSFYVIVPYTPSIVEMQKEGFKKILSNILGKEPKANKFQEDKLEEYKNQLWQRVEAISQGLIRSGVRTIPLDTEELIELFFGLYNPGELEKGRAPEINQ